MEKDLRSMNPSFYFKATGKSEKINSKVSRKKKIIIKIRAKSVS